MINLEMHKINSSNINKIGYDVASKTLRIAFKGGYTYDYTDVPERLYIGLKSSNSPGRFFVKNIRDKFAFKKIV